jgi:16S rRNA (cytosine1402-N4)-methyltransferase
MSQEGPTAADLVNETPEAELANIIFLYGEERASRRIAKTIIRAREEAPIETTLHLAGLVERCLPRPKPGQTHPATRTFQAIRIAVNDEYGALIEGLEAAERALKPGGQLAVVTFHSIEDRMVIRFLQIRAGATGGGSRHAPKIEQPDPQFTLKSRKAIVADAQELDENPRARSAKLRVATRTEAPAGHIDRSAIGMPMLKGGK